MDTSSKAKKTKYTAFEKLSTDSNKHLERGTTISIIMFFSMVSSRVRVKLYSTSRHKVTNFSFYACMV